MKIIEPGARAFIVMRLALDPMENEVSAAISWEPYAVTVNETSAIEIVKAGRIFTKKDCWAIWGTQPEFKYIEAPILEVEEGK